MSKHINKYRLCAVLVAFVAIVAAPAAHADTATAVSFPAISIPFADTTPKDCELANATKPFFQRVKAEAVNTAETDLPYIIITLFAIGILLVATKMGRAIITNGVQALIGLAALGVIGALVIVVQGNAAHC